MANASTNWSITYQYQQDLSSKLFNQINTKTYRPGIYNPNIFIKAFDSVAGESSRGLKLLVKKGTTFIFSNTYKKDPDGSFIRYHRDWDELDENAYVIKCTALADIETNIIDLTSTGESGKRFLSTNCPVMALVASISFEEATTQAPSFKLCAPSIFYDSAYFHAGSSIPSNLTIPMEGWTNVAADEQGIGCGSNFGHLSYLVVGMIYDTGVTRKAGSSVIFNGTYIQSTSSDTWVLPAGGNAGGCEAWNVNHIFTGRGLPEYDHEWTRESKYLDFINSPYFNKYFLPRKYFLMHQGLREIGSSDWKSIIGQYDLESGKDTLNGGGLAGNRLLSSGVGFRAPSTIEPNKCYVYVARLGKSGSSPGSVESGSESSIANDSSLEIGYVALDISGFETFTKKYSEDVSLGDYIPLDVSDMNLSILEEFIRNKNFFEPAINKIRLDGYMMGPPSAGSEDVRLENNSDEKTCYIPIALAFTGNEDTGIAGVFTDRYWWGLIKGTGSESASSESTTLNISGFRPENVLSYSDLLKKYINLDGFALKPYQTLAFLG